MEWVTPLGLPVVQPYHKPVMKQVWVCGVWVCRVCGMWVCGCKYVEEGTYVCGMWVWSVECGAVCVLETVYSYPNIKSLYSKNAQLAQPSWVLCTHGNNINKPTTRPDHVIIAYSPTWSYSLSLTPPPLTSLCLPTRDDRKWGCPQILSTLLTPPIWCSHLYTVTGEWAYTCSCCWLPW